MEDLDITTPYDDPLFQLYLRRIQRAEQEPHPLTEALGAIEGAGKGFSDYRTAREMAQQKLSGRATAAFQMLSPVLRGQLTEEEKLRDREWREGQAGKRAEAGYKLQELKGAQAKEQEELKHKLRMERDKARGLGRKGGATEGTIPGMRQSQANAVVSQAKSVMDGITAKLRASRNLSEAEVIKQATDSTRAWIQQKLPRLKPEVIESVVQVARGGGPSVEGELGGYRGELGIEEAERRRKEAINTKLQALSLNATSLADAERSVSAYLNQIGETEDAFDDFLEANPEIEDLLKRLPRE